MIQQFDFCWLLLSFCLAHFSAEAADPDPCTNYTELPDPDGKLSTSSFSRQPYEGHLLLSTGWYRVLSPGGTDMPSVCVELRHCNTYYPMWLNGELPPNDGREHTISTVRTTTDCTSPRILDQPITVKNCGDYRVYYLLATREYDKLPSGYCFGTLKISTQSLTTSTITTTSPASIFSSAKTSVDSTDNDKTTENLLSRGSLGSSAAASIVTFHTVHPLLNFTNPSPIMPMSSIEPTSEDPNSFSPPRSIIVGLSCAAIFIVISVAAVIIYTRMRRFPKDEDRIGRIQEVTTKAENDYLEPISQGKWNETRQRNSNHESHIYHEISEDNSQEYGTKMDKSNSELTYYMSMNGNNVTTDEQK